MYLRLASEDPLTTTTKGEGIQVPAAMTGEEANVTELIRTEVYLDVAGVEADDAGFRGKTKTQYAVRVAGSLIEAEVDNGH